MQSLRVLLVFVALSQVECAPPSIWAAHRFSPPELWPFKQQPAAPSPHAFFTHFPQTSHSPSQIALPVETVVVEPIIAAGNTVPTEVLPKESVLPSEIFVQEVVEVKSAPQPQKPMVFVTPLPEVTIESAPQPQKPMVFVTLLPEVAVESAPQPQEPVVFGNKMVKPLLEVAVETVTDVPVQTFSVTTAAPLSFRDTEHFQAYEQFLSTWLQQASLTLNRPELLHMFKPTKQNIAIPEISSTKKSVEKSVEKVVEQVTVSESVEPQVTPVEVASPEISKTLKNVSGPLKKTPETLLSKSSTDVLLAAVRSSIWPGRVPSLDAAVPSESLDIPVLTSNPALESQIKFELVPENPPVQEQTIDFVVEPNFFQPEPVPSLEVVVPSEQLEMTFIASDPALETLNIEVVDTPEQIAYELINETPIVHEQTISEIDLVAEPSFVQPEPVPSLEDVLPSNPLEITFIASDPALDSQNLEVVATPEQIVYEIIPESPIVQEQTISEVDLVAEPSFLQPVVVSRPAVEEIILSVDPQLTESSYSKLSVSPTGTISVAPNPQDITSSVLPSLVETVPEPAQPTVIESFSPQGLTYTLKYYPRHRSSFFYSHALGV